MLLYGKESFNKLCEYDNLILINPCLQIPYLIEICGIDRKINAATRNGKWQYMGLFSLIYLHSFGFNRFFPILWLQNSFYFRQAHYISFLHFYSVFLCCYAFSNKFSLLFSNLFSQNSERRLSCLFSLVLNCLMLYACRRAHVFTLEGLYHCRHCKYHNECKRKSCGN